MRGDAASSPRRWRWLTCLVAVLGLTWAASGIATAGASATVRASDGQAIEVLRDDGRIWNVVGFEPGRRLQLSVEIERRGPLPVRITGVDDTRGRTSTASCGWSLEDVTVTTDHGEVVLTEGGQRRATGALVPRGEHAVLDVSGPFTGEPGCLPRGHQMARNALFVDVEVAGIPSRRRVKLPEVLTWSTDPVASADRLARAPVAPRVGSAA